MASLQTPISSLDQDRIESVGAYTRGQHQANRNGMFSTFEQISIKQDPKATTMAIVINGLVIASVLLIGATTVRTVVIPTSRRVVKLVASIPPPLPKAPPNPVVMSGGGGHPAVQAVSRGNPPKLAAKPVLLLATNLPRVASRLLVEPTLNVQPELKLAKADLSSLGMPNAVPAVVVSLGNGSGTGLGSGSGNGLGSGSGGNYGGGVFKVGGGVAAPRVVSAPEPSFTEEARQGKVSGKVVVYLQVNPEGRPMHVRVIEGLGMGLDEKAAEAVRQYRFKPATRDGHPVTVEMNIAMKFQIV